MPFSRNFSHIYEFQTLSLRTMYWVIIYQAMCRVKKNQRGMLKLTRVIKADNCYSQVHHHQGKSYHKKRALGCPKGTGVCWCLMRQRGAKEQGECVSCLSSSSALTLATWWLNPVQKGTPAIVHKSQSSWAERGREEERGGEGRRKEERGGEKRERRRKEERGSEKRRDKQRKKRGGERKCKGNEHSSSWHHCRTN